MEKTKKEIQDDVSLLQAEKRTSLAVLRTAVALFTLPLSVITILLATSKYYDPMESFYLFNTISIYQFNSTFIWIVSGYPIIQKDKENRS